MVTRIQVSGERPYEVLVGRDLAGELPALIDGAARVAVLYSAPLRAHAEGIAARIGARPLPIEVPDAEHGKTVEVAARCWDELGAANFTRTDVVVGVGGGAVTDLAGFVAASWLGPLGAGLDLAARHGRRLRGRQDRGEHRGR